MSAVTNFPKQQKIIGVYTTERPHQVLLTNWMLPRQRNTPMGLNVKDSPKKEVETCKTGNRKICTRISYCYNSALPCKLKSPKTSYLTREKREGRGRLNEENSVFIVPNMEMIEGENVDEHESP